MDQPPFAIRGVIEAFYGAFYTFPERNDLIEFIGRHGYNLYIYGPKNDRQHRQRWWELYPPEIMEEFSSTTRLAAAAGVQFCYAISPIQYDPARDFPKLTEKLYSLYRCGVRSFSLLVDDLMCVEHLDPFCKVCPRPAELHADVCNQVYAWLQSLGESVSLSMCPTDYHGKPPFSSYLRELGERLHPAIDVFYTGREVCSPAIQTSDAQAFAEAVGRPPLIWDNYPVNDLGMRPRMHIGPIRGREGSLHEAVKGIVVNPMLQAEASKIPLLTFADYFRDPHGYDPSRSFERALVEVGGQPNYKELRLFAENSIHSCLSLTETPKLERLAQAALEAIKQHDRLETNAALEELRNYLNSLDEACYALKFRMSNLRLRDNLLPWVEALDAWTWVGKRVFQVIDHASEPKRLDQYAGGLSRSLKEIGEHRKLTAGNKLLPLARYVVELSKQAKHQRTVAAAHDHVPAHAPVSNHALNGAR